MVISITEKQDHDDGQRFKSNLKRELNTLERRKAFAGRMTIGRGAVLYFGPYFGGLIFFAGLFYMLIGLGILQFSESLLISIIVMVAGSFVIMGSLFTSRVVMRVELERMEWGK